MKTIIFFFLLLLSPLCRADDAHVFNKEVILDNTIAWSCEGKGSPTIVLIAGLGLDAHGSFDLVYHQYHGKGKICMYDRPGLGQSSFKQKRIRKLDDLVEELHELKIKLNWQDLVLVPHSFGGFIARGYASKYPDDVKGVVFMDVTHEDWMPRLEQKMSEADFAIMKRIIAWSTSTFNEDYLEAQEACRRFVYPKTLPSTFISRGIPTTKLRRNHMSYEGIAIFNDEHDKLQMALTSLSRNSRHVVAKVAGHEINSFDPWLVIDEIASTVDKVQLQ